MVLSFNVFVRTKHQWYKRCITFGPLSRRRRRRGMAESQNATLQYVILQQVIKMAFIKMTSLFNSFNCKQCQTKRLEASPRDSLSSPI